MQRLRVASSFERVEMCETCISLLSSEVLSGFDVAINESGSEGGAVEELSASAVCEETALLLGRGATDPHRGRPRCRVSC